MHMCRPQYLKLIMPCVIWAYTIVIVYTHTPPTLVVCVHLLQNTPGGLTKIKQKKRKNAAWSEGSQFLRQHSDSKATIWCKQHEKMESSCLVSTIQATGAVIIFWRIFSWHSGHCWMASTCTRSQSNLLTENSQLVPLSESFYVCSVYLKNVLMFRMIKYH